MDCYLLWNIIGISDHELRTLIPIHFKTLTVLSQTDKKVFPGRYRF
jgi:hypothetical protein